MSGGLEARVDRAIGRWMGFVDRRAGGVLLAVLLLTAALGVYAARTLTVNADTAALIADDVEFKQVHRAFSAAFHPLDDAMLVVIDADSAAKAQRAADRLAERLRADPATFARVYVPGGGPFFARAALLYLEPASLEQLADRLAKVQPFLAELAQDQSLGGLAGLMADALAAQRKGDDVGLDLATALDRVREAVEATTAGRAAPDPWGNALLGDTLPGEARRRVVALDPHRDMSDVFGVGPAVDAVRAAARELGLDEAHGVRVRMTGDAILNYEEQFAIADQARRVVLVSLALFTAAAWVALRSVRIIVALVGGLLVALVWSNAFAAAAIGHLNQVSAAFNVLVIGLGGEFGIHVCMRFKELVAAGRTRRAALVETGTSIGSSLVSSAGTTAIGFLVFLPTDYSGVAQLGLISGVGMFLSLGSTLTVLPALLAFRAAEAPAGAAATLPAIARLRHLPIAYASGIRIAAAVLAVGAVTLLPRARFDYNQVNMRDPSTESVQTIEDLLSEPGSSPWTIDVVAPNLAEADRLAARVRALPVVARALTLTDYVPVDQDAKREVLETAALFVPPVAAGAGTADPAAERAALERLASATAATAAAEPATPLGTAARKLHDALAAFLAGPGAAPGGAALATLASNLVGSLPSQLVDLERMVNPGVVALADLPADLQAQMVAADGRARIQVFPKDDLSDSVALQRFVDQVRTVAPGSTGVAVRLVEWGRITTSAMTQALVAGLAATAVFLYFLWRNAWDTVLAFFPLALAAVLTCAALVVIGQPFNFANVIVLPMLLGMGIDNGVHLVHRHRAQPEEEDVLATSTARAVTFSAITTILSFGSLAFTSHKGMAALGRLLVVGVAMTLLCYVVVLPAVLEWDDRRRARAAGAG